MITYFTILQSRPLAILTLIDLKRRSYKKASRTKQGHLIFWPLSKSSTGIPACSNLPLPTFTPCNVHLQNSFGLKPHLPPRRLSPVSCSLLPPSPRSRLASQMGKHYQVRVRSHCTIAHNVRGTV